MRNRLLLLSLAVASCLAACMFHSTHGQESGVSSNCLGCICFASSNCNTTIGCTSAGLCGPFLISYPYWADAGKYIVAGDDASRPTAYSTCTNSVICATQTVRSYMDKFRQDCNGDGAIDCFDFARIHKAGGYGCKDPGVTNSQYYVNFVQCMNDNNAVK